MARIGGIVLCGGRSVRMGCDKSQLRLGNRTLLERVIDAVLPAAEAIVLVGPHDGPLPSYSPPGEQSLRVPIFETRDSLADQGPLHAIVQGWASMPADIETAFVAPCDLGLLTTAWIEHLATYATKFPIVLARKEGELQPLGGFYSRCVIPTAERLLAEGRRSAKQLTAIHPTRILEEAELTTLFPGLWPLADADTPEAFAQVEAEWRREANLGESG